MLALFASRWKTSVLIVSKQQLVRIIRFRKIIALVYTVNIWLFKKLALKKRRLEDCLNEYHTCVENAFDGMISI